MNSRANIVRLSRPVHPLLRRLAAEQGVEPVELVCFALEQAGTKKGAAEILGVDRKTFSRWLERLEIKVVAA
jgi:transcriptional regulator with GAF, ATPase, and Fis domain